MYIFLFFSTIARKVCEPFNWLQDTHTHTQEGFSASLFITQADCEWSKNNIREAFQVAADMHRENRCPETVLREVLAHFVL